MSLFSLFRRIAPVAFMSFILVNCATSPGVEPGEEIYSTAPGEYVTIDLGTAETMEELAQEFIVNIGDRIFFELGRSGLTDAAKTELIKQADFLRQNQEVNVTIEGHCDERGTREFNIALGLRRANSVREYFATAGIDPYRLQVVSFGKERPIAACSRERCWRVNRRAVTTIDGAESGISIF